MMAESMRSFSLLCLAALGVHGPAMAQVDLATDLKAINASFVCPEKMSSDALRRDAMNEIGRRLASHRLTYSQAQKVIHTMYGLHGCGTSSPVTAIASANPAAAAP